MQIVMNLYMLCKAFSMNFSLEELKRMHAEEAYFVEQDVQRLIEEERLNPTLKRYR